MRHAYNQLSPRMINTLSFKLWVSVSLWVFCWVAHIVQYKISLLQMPSCLPCIGFRLSIHAIAWELFTCLFIPVLDSTYFAIFVSAALWMLLGTEALINRCSYLYVLNGLHCSYSLTVKCGSWKHNRNTGSQMEQFVIKPALLKESR